MVTYEMVGIDGMVHFYPEWFYVVLTNLHRKLKREERIGSRQYREHVIVRDNERRMWAIQPSAVKHLEPLLSTPYFNPSKHVRALDFSFASGRPADSGRKNQMDIFSCGIDEQVNRRLAHQNADELDRLRYADPNAVDVDLIVKDTIARRKYR